MRASEPPPRARTVLGLSILFTLLNLPFLVRGRPVWQDEVEFSIVGYRLAFDGHFGSHFWGGAFGMDTHYYSYLPLYSLFLAGIYRVFGFGIVQTRILDIVLYGMCVGLTYELGRRVLGSRRGGFWSALLLGANPLFIWAGRSARPEPLMVFFALAGWIALDEALEGKGAGGSSLWIFLSGILMALSASSHPLGLLFPVSGGVYVLGNDLGRHRDGMSVPRPVGRHQAGRRRLLTYLAAFVGGWVFAMIPWAFYIAQDPPGFVGQMRLHSQMGGRLLDVIGGFRVGDFLKMRGWGSMGMGILIFYALGYVAVGLLLLANRMAGIRQRWVWVLLILGFVAASVAKPHVGVGTPYRFVGAAPFVAIGLAAIWIQARSKGQWLEPKLWGAILAGLVVFGSIGGLGARYLLWPALEGDLRDAEDFSEEVASFLTPGARVLGPSEVWYAVGGVGGRLQNDYTLTNVANGLIPAELVDMDRFDFVVTRDDLQDGTPECRSPDPALALYCRLVIRCAPPAMVTTGEKPAGTSWWESFMRSPYRAFIYRVDPACYD